MYNVVQQVIKLSNGNYKMKSYCPYQRLAGVLTIVFVIISITISAQGRTVIDDQSQFDENEIRKRQNGQLDVLESDFVIISDISYLITSDTDFFDSEDDLEIGAVVWFKTSDDNNYIEAIYLDESSASASVDQSEAVSDNDTEEIGNSASPTEVRLEKGVWVN